VDAPGFSQSQQRRIGDLVLSQRGGLRKVEGTLANTSFAWQAMCLRLAVIKCHARDNVRLDTLALAARDRDALLRFPPEWAAAHPRTVYLLGEEAETWSRAGTLRLVLPS